MSSIFDKAREIVRMEISIEEKEQRLLALGLAPNEVSQALLAAHAQLEKQQRETRLKRPVHIDNTPTPGSMKCLAIRQPWATLVVSGIKDTELRNQMVPPCNKFLVAASVTRDTDDLSEVLGDDLLDLVMPYIQSGALPPCREWPTGAIIGWVELDRATFDEVDSPWAWGHEGIKYVIKHAYMFDKPIRGKNKATPFFYNVEGIDPDHLPPYHQVKK